MESAQDVKVLHLFALGRKEGSEKRNFKNK